MLGYRARGANQNTKKSKKSVHPESLVRPELHCAGAASAAAAARKLRVFEGLALGLPGLSGSGSGLRDFLKFRHA